MRAPVLGDPGRLRDALALTRDDFLLEVCKHFNVPVVTNEGVSPRGIGANKKKGKLRRKCRESGVAVYAPKEYRGHLSVDIDGPGFEKALRTLLAHYAFVVLDQMAEGLFDPPADSLAGS